MKRDRHLPAAMYHSHGAYYLVRRNKWIRLGTELGPSLQAYAQHVRSQSGTLPGLLDRFLLRCKPTVAPNTYASYASAAKRLQWHLEQFSPENVRPTTVAKLLDHHRAHPELANQMRMNERKREAASKPFAMDVGSFREEDRLPCRTS